MAGLGHFHQLDGWSGALPDSLALTALLAAVLWPWLRRRRPPRPPRPLARHPVRFFDVFSG
jgi:hypothetical protein